MFYNENFWHGVYENMPESHGSPFDSIIQTDAIARDINNLENQLAEKKAEYQTAILLVIADLCDEWTAEEIKQGIKDYIVYAN